MTLGFRLAMGQIRISGSLIDGRGLLVNVGEMIRKSRRQTQRGESTEMDCDNNYVTLQVCSKP